MEEIKLNRGMEGL